MVCSVSSLSAHEHTPDLSNGAMSLRSGRQLDSEPSNNTGLIIGLVAGGVAIVLIGLFCFCCVGNKEYDDSSPRKQSHPGSPLARILSMFSTDSEDITLTESQLQAQQTVDVHKCTSSLCEQCTVKENGASFISVKRDKRLPPVILESPPKRWWDKDDKFEVNVLDVQLANDASK
jgi:hypothetical protein|eukprot:CAMPEP_0198298728 /NCGR_PEP_ID=MMETSP1449-20131203/41927_1 /TAXON_ID=420275 /ORGANISM="Attheya septentrionalis, Strain CCMP2084" /LENGTH=174 /DNA_ID=CAMNT_0044000071 /DNA_START=241 /DNA_END=765 /DNA_ORIENTATION=+